MMCSEQGLARIKAHQNRRVWACHFRQGRKIQTWVRLADNQEQAEAQFRQALEQEMPGAVFVGVVEL